MTNDNTAICLFFKYFMFTKKYLSQCFTVCKSICNTGQKRNVFKTEQSAWKHQPGLSGSQYLGIFFGRHIKEMRLSGQKTKFPSHRQTKPISFKINDYFQILLRGKNLCSLEIGKIMKDISDIRDETQTTTTLYYVTITIIEPQRLCKFVSN